MHISEIKIQLARMPIGKVAGAYQTHVANPKVGITKTEAVNALAELIDAGVINLENVANAAPSTLATAAPDPAVGAKIDATSVVADRAQADALSALNRIDDLAAIVTKAIDSMTKVDAKVGRLADKVGAIKVDDSAVRLSVEKLIGDHFGRFAKLVEDKGAAQFIGDLTAVHRVDSKTCAEVFGIEVKDARGVPMTVDLWNHPDAPAVDPDFIWTEGILRHLLLSDKTGENLWFGGEKGTGKSETARQFAARTGRAFKRINFHKHTTVEEYIGSVGLVNGQTVFQPKDFLSAYACPSTVILLDEITNADPGELATLNGFLEPNACVSFGGKTHTRAPGVLVFVADNTFGSGDDSGRHAGTRMQNSALVDRFARVIPFTFLPEEFEIDAISRRSGCNRVIATHIHKAITLAREKVRQAEIVDAPSIRSAIAFARAIEVLPVREAWETTITARQPSESHVALQGIFETAINAELIASNL
jgi:MoxR-like ATPase